MYTPLHASERQDAGYPSAPKAWYGLAAIIILSLYGYIDRQIFILLAEPIRQTFDLSDFQLGLIQGFGLTLVAAAASYPVAWLSDRYDRRYVLIGCVLVWSLAVVCCGLADTFTQLLIASALVGAGEGGLAPIVYSSLPEMFNRSQRQTANSTYMACGRLGVGLAIALCGYLIYLAGQVQPNLPEVFDSMETWRIAFFLTAMPLPLIILLVMTLPISGRAKRISKVSKSAAKETEKSSANPFQFISLHRSTFVWLYTGLAFSFFGLTALLTWIPVVAMRQFGASAEQVGGAFGVATFVASLTGLIITGLGVGRLKLRFGASTPIVAMGVSCFGAGVIICTAVFASSWIELFIIMGAHMTFLMTGLMMYPTVVQDAAPAHLRGRMIAVAGIVMLVGGSIAAPTVGLLSDILGEHADSLLRATILIGAPTLIIGAGCQLIAHRAFANTVAAAERAEEEWSL